MSDPELVDAWSMGKTYQTYEQERCASLAKRKVRGLTEQQLVDEMVTISQLSNSYKENWDRERELISEWELIQTKRGAQPLNPNYWCICRSKTRMLGYTDQECRHNEMERLHRIIANFKAITTTTKKEGK